MTWKSDAKFKEKLTCGFKCDMRNLVNFHPTTQKSEKFTSMGYFCLKYMRSELKKHRAVIFHDTEQLCKIWINPDLEVLKWHEELGELSLENPKVWKLYIYGFFLSKAYTVSVRKFQKNYVSWHWRLLKSLNGNRVVAWKKWHLVNCHVSSWKSENLHFDWIHLSKAYKYLDEKVQKSYVSWNWRVM